MRRWAAAVLAGLASRGYAGGFEQAASEIERSARAARAAIVRLRGCPGADSVSREWVDHAGDVPAARLAGHLALPPAWAAPLMLPVHGVSFWVGVSLRGGGHGDCFLDGSVAFYFNGPEDVPEVDFVQRVSRGAELELGAKMLELRWFDPSDGRKHRWFNAALARRLGWFTTGDGRNDESYRPIPLPAAGNSLY